MHLWMFSWVPVAMHVKPAGTAPSVLNQLDNKDLWWKKRSWVTAKRCHCWGQALSWRISMSLHPPLLPKVHVCGRGITALLSCQTVAPDWLLPGYPFQLRPWPFPVVACQPMKRDRAHRWALSSQSGWLQWGQSTNLSRCHPSHSFQCWYTQDLWKQVEPAEWQRLAAVVNQLLPTFFY